MPNTRSSSIRDIIIDRCLRSKSPHTLKDIWAAVNKELESRDERPVTSKCTILSHIYEISNRFGVSIDITKRGRYSYYRYEDPDFTIYRTPLNEEEVVNLASTLVMLKRFQGIPNFEWIEEFVEKSKATIADKIVDDAVICLEENPYVKGIQFLTPIYNAIVNKKVVNIDYRPFTASEVQTHIFHPYYLKQYNTRWFLFGCNDKYRTISTFALDRIERIEDNETVLYADNDVCDFNEYFEDMVGVSKSIDAPIETIQLWICKEQWPYNETKPLHGSQKVIKRNEDGSVVVQIEVCQNWELDQLILLHGDRMKVISPKSLQDRIKQRIKRALDLYLE